MEGPGFGNSGNSDLISVDLLFRCREGGIYFDLVLLLLIAGLHKLVFKMDRKRKGGAEKLRDKKKLKKEAEKCGKLDYFFKEWNVETKVAEESSMCSASVALNTGLPSIAATSMDLPSSIKFNTSY